jgi:hypothetical protein
LDEESWDRWRQAWPIMWVHRICFF